MLFAPTQFMPQPSGGGGLDPATTAWVSAVVTAGGTVSGGRETIVDTLIKGLKTDGLWTILDRMWLFAAENSQQALIDIVATAAMVNSNGLTFTANQGWTGNGAGIDSNFDPSTAGGNYSQNSACLGTWVYTSGPPNSCTVAEGTTSPSQTVIFDNFSGQTYMRVNDASASAAIEASPGTGFYHAVRTSSTARTGYFNGSQIQNITNTSGGISSGDFSWFGNPTYGFSTGTLAIGCFGGGMNSTQAGNLYTSLNTYMGAI